MDGDVIVLACGPSVREYNLRNLEARGILIAINGGAMYVKPHVAFTMDRLVAELCVPVWRLQGVPDIYVRDGIAKNFKTDGLRVFKHDGNDPVYMTPVEGYLNGSNSGSCALNLAFQYAPKRVFMLGYDMQRGGAPEEHPYWFPPYAWNTYGSAKNGKLREWAEEFVELQKQFTNRGIELYNVNHRSKISAVEKITFAEFEELTSWS